MKEIWKNIKEYEELYEISSKGRIKTKSNNKTKKEKIKRTRVDKNGYVKVDLYKNGKIKTFSVHRLVAEHFIPNDNNLPEINHKDENPRNNTVENLEWCTRKYNINYGNRTKKCSIKLKGRNSRKIKQYDMNNNFIKEWISMSEASKELNINKTGISNCCKKKQYTAGSYKWEYAK